MKKPRKEENQDEAEARRVAAALRKIKAILKRGGRALTKSEAAEVASRRPPLSPFDNQQWQVVPHPAPPSTGKRGRPPKAAPPTSPAQDMVARRVPLYRRLVKRPANARKQLADKLIPAAKKKGAANRARVAEYDARSLGRKLDKPAAPAKELGLSVTTVRRQRRRLRNPTNA